MNKLTTIAAALGSVVLMSYGGTAQADIIPFTPSAYAESELLVTNFRILDGAGASVIPLVNSGVISNLAATVTSTMSASINGIPGTVLPAASVTIDPLLATNPSITQTVATGPSAGNYVPYTIYPVSNLATGVFSGAASNHSGNGLGLNGAPYTTATTQAQVNINGATAQGSSDSRQQLGTDFKLTVNGIQTFQVLFDAASYFRIALGQEDVMAGASREWNVKVTQLGSLIDLLDWAPQGGGATGKDLDGLCVGAGACSVLFDPFDLNFNTTIQSTADLAETNISQAFGLSITLASGDYTISLSHKTGADASAIPEPGSLALLGLGMFGLAGLRRRSKKV